MRESLKHIFSRQEVLEDGSVYYYSVSSYDLKNALGNNIVALQEYSCTKKGDEHGDFSCKLYKTKDGNWYNFEDAKSAVEAKENTEVG